MSATLFVLVGLPGAGKTTRARQLEARHGALRLTPDEWMIPLFGEPEADGRRDVLEGRFVWLALRALRLGVDVVLDFGVWSRHERSALRALAADAGARCELVYLPVDEIEQRRRVADRLGPAAGTVFAMTDEDLARYREVFEAPDDDELASEGVGAPPRGCATWRDWAARRWPTSTGGLVSPE